MRNNSTLFHKPVELFPAPPYIDFVQKLNRLAAMKLLRVFTGAIRNGDFGAGDSNTRLPGVKNTRRNLPLSPVEPFLPAAILDHSFIDELFRAPLVIYLLRTRGQRRRILSPVAGLAGEEFPAGATVEASHGQSSRTHG